MAKAMETVTIFIDNQAYQVDKGNNLLAGVLSQKLNLPYFCWHPSMGSVGACRQCAVTQYQDENDQRGRLVMACTTPVTEGMRIGLKEPAAEKFREQVISAMMTNHPHDCPVCAEGGECHLQDMTVMTGHSSRSYQGKKRTFTNQNLGEFVGHEMNRCITCYRCMRFYNDYAGGKDFGVFGSKNQVYFGRQTDGQLESEFSGNLVEVCPTGVFTNKLFSAHFSRKWDLQSAPSICAHCSVGCNTSIGERYGSVRRVVNRFHPDINGYFLCDRGRFGIGFVNGEQRLKTTKGINQLSPEKLSRLDVAKTLVHHRGKKFIGIGSARASLEANAYLQQLVGSNNFSAGLSNQQMAMAATHLSLLNKYIVPSVAQIEDSDFILILGEDITQTAPRAALAVRQALRNVSFDKAADIGIPSWQDSAVRTIGGTERTPLFALQSTPTKLDEVSQATMLLAPEQLSQCIEALITKVQLMLGLSVSSEKHELLATLPTEKLRLLEQITQSLLKAKKPLVVTGWSLQSPALLKSTEQLMSVLHSDDFMRYNNESSEESEYLSCQLAIFPPESNSLGLMSLLEQESLSNEQVLTQLSHDSGDNDVFGVILLEQQLANFSNNQLQQLRQQAQVIIAIDHSESEISNLADIVMPATAISEGDGHFANYQGILQRYYQVHTTLSPVQESWRWLNLLAISVFQQPERVDSFAHLQKVLAEECKNWPINISKDVENDDVGIARQTHRNSGRTSQSANFSVHEPQVTKSSASVNTFEPPLNFSMEGKSAENSSSQPFAWAPGWNSNQSINHNSSGNNSESSERCFIYLKSDPLLNQSWSASEEESPSQPNLQTEPVAHSLFIRQSTCFHDDWQANFNAEFTLKLPINQLTMSTEQLSGLGLKSGNFVKVLLADQQVVGKAYVDESLSENLCYGFFHQLTATITNITAYVSKANDDEIAEHLSNQQQLMMQAKEQQAQVLARLKITDQLVPIRMVSGGLDEH